jgi:hypothetical protein
MSPVSSSPKRRVRTKDQRHPADRLQQADDHSGKLRRGNTERGEESTDAANAHLEELLLPMHHEDDPDHDPQQRDPPRLDRRPSPRIDRH